MKEGNTVWYGMTRTINTGNYESLKIDIGESRSVDDGDSEEVYKAVRKDVNERMATIVRKIQKDTDEQ